MAVDVVLAERRKNVVDVALVGAAINVELEEFVEARDAAEAADDIEPEFVMARNVVSAVIAEERPDGQSVDAVDVGAVVGVAEHGVDAVAQAETV